LRKVTIRFVMSVCQSVRLPVFPSGTALFPMTDFHEILYLSIFRKFVEKIQVYLYSTRVTGTLHADQYTILIISCSFFLDWKMFQIFRKSRRTFYVQICFVANHAVYKMIWKNIVDPGRPHMTIWCMRITCIISKATNTHSEYVIFIAFSLQKWLHEMSSVLRCSTFTVMSE
jgi:hypothetical protein